MGRPQFAALLLLAAVPITSGPRLRGGSHDQSHAVAARLYPPKAAPAPPPTVAEIEANSADDVAYMVAKRKALLGTARGLRPDVIAEQLPALDSAYTVTSEMKEHFSRDGWALLPGLVSAGELDSYRPILLDIARATAEERHTSHTRSYQLWQKHAATRKFTLGERFAQVIYI